MLHVRPSILFTSLQAAIANIFDREPAPAVRGITDTAPVPIHVLAVVAGTRCLRLCHTAATHAIVAAKSAAFSMGSIALGAR
jgi:hypothetical protein